MDLMHHFLAGIWPLLLKYTFAVGGIGAALALAWFFPPFRKWALAAAAVIAAGLVIFHLGVVDGANRVEAQWDAAVEAAVRKGEEARAAAERDINGTPAGRVPGDRYDRDQH